MEDALKYLKKVKEGHRGIEIMLVTNNYRLQDIF